MNPKTKPVKARREYEHVGSGVLQCESPQTRKWPDNFNPVYVLPADADSQNRMIAQAAVALEQADSCDHREDACIVFRSIGILPPHGEGRK